MHASGDMKELMKQDDHATVSRFVSECMEIVDDIRNIKNPENEIE